MRNKLEKDYSNSNPDKVIATYLKNEQDRSLKELNLSDFSFSKSKKILEKYNGSFSQTVIDERKLEL